MWIFLLSKKYREDGSCVSIHWRQSLLELPQRKNIHIEYTFHHLMKELALLPYYIFISYWKKLLPETETISPLLYNHSCADGGDAGENSLRKVQKVCPSWTKATKRLNAKNQATDKSSWPHNNSHSKVSKSCWKDNLLKFKHWSGMWLSEYHTNLYNDVSQSLSKKSSNGRHFF